MSTFNQVKEIIVEELGLDPEEIQLSTHFADDLDADSLDVFQIIGELEDQLDIEIDTDQDLNTVQDLVAYIDQIKA